MTVPPSSGNDPAALVRTRSYLVLLVLGALIGIPVSVVAYFYLQFVTVAQKFVFVTFPKDLGFSSAPTWWPILPLHLSGLLVGLTLQYVRGTGGHKPAEGFKTSGATDPIDLPGIFLASLATLCLGAVLGPAAPLIAIGSGLGVLAVHLVKKDAPATAALAPAVPALRACRPNPKNRPPKKQKTKTHAAHCVIGTTLPSCTPVGCLSLVDCLSPRAV